MPEERRKVAVLVEDDYEDLELWYPYFRLMEAGYEPVLIGPREGTYRGKHGYEAKVALSADQADVRELLGLVIRGDGPPTGSGGTPRS